MKEKRKEFLRVGTNSLMYQRVDLKPTSVKGKGRTEDFFFFHWLFIPTNTHEILFKLLIIASTILLKTMTLLL
ncbi:hypothetical protein LEP1GSC038_2424 [Leptospira weilii str. 2006001855]|uniref:Uncharacterized protein n=3 Tax=Leptospira weilii TaxID=28184 RepID=M6FNM8_9LEPT|nr:hypothetical protein LEP1GSC038_2424 [Leptospira weilii str. 2006001855]